MPFNPNRLSIARKRRMLNKKGLAELAGVSQHTIVRYEKGTTDDPPAEIVEMLARALDFPVEFFFLPDADQPLQASFRSYTTMSAAVRDAALAAGSIGFLISDWIEQRFDLPRSDIPDLHLYDPEHAARVLRQEWGLGEKPISNMIHLLESRGVRVFSLMENTRTINAYSIWRNGKPFVFLNTFKSAESSRFDAAHELGHLVLHQDGGETGRAAEDQANQFASAFLMPKADILATIPIVHSLEHMLRTKTRWKVSLAALNHRLHKLTLLSDWRYRDYCIEISRRGFNKREPLEIERERSVVWQKILQALWKERTTQAHIACDLNVPESEVNDLVFGIIHSGLPAKPQRREALRVIGAP